MADYVCLLRFASDSKSDMVNGKISFSPTRSFKTPDEVPAAYWAGLRLMHVFSLLPDDGFVHKLEDLLASYPVPESLKVFKFAK